MSRHGKVIVAMSGGVDSSVAAALLKEQGYECIGVFLRTGVSADGPESQAAEIPADEAPRRRLRHGCCSVNDALDARAVANRLGISFYVMNFADEFERLIAYFVDEYAQARTPNPCVRCNIDIKFGKLLRYAQAMDAEFVATGHYARVLRDGPAPRLARSANQAKDQSYVLFGIARADLGRCLFPLGDMPDKAQVRALAAQLALRVHDKPDSQEICFVPENDYKPLVAARRPHTQRPGEVRDPEGHVLGAHGGIVNFTIGQRHGLGIAAGKPVYVTRLDVLNNVVTLGPREMLLSAGLVAERINWLVDAPPADGAVAAVTKIRHTHTPASGRIRRRLDETVEAQFDEPQLAVTPGQAAVFYDGDVVLGGGWIREALPAPDV